MLLDFLTWVNKENEIKTCLKMYDRSNQLICLWTLVKMPSCFWQQVDRKIRNCDYLEAFISIFSGITGNSIILESLWTASITSQYTQSHHCYLPWGHQDSSCISFSCLYMFAPEAKNSLLSCNAYYDPQNHYLYTLIS